MEMRVYILDVDRNGEEEPIGRIVVLEYTDDDGVVDKSTVVMDGLILPRAIAIVKGGLFVALPPTLCFCEDLDGDLEVDRKTRGISANEIEEFIMRVQKPGTRGNKAVVTIGVSLEIQAISDADQLSFGAGLPPDELEYIYALAKGILIS